MVQPSTPSRGSDRFIVVRIPWFGQVWFSPLSRVDPDSVIRRYDPTNGNPGPAAPRCTRVLPRTLATYLAVVTCFSRAYFVPSRFVRHHDSLVRGRAGTAPLCHVRVLHFLLKVVLAEFSPERSVARRASLLAPLVSSSQCHSACRLALC